MLFRGKMLFFRERYLQEITLSAYDKTFIGFDVIFLVAYGCYRNLREFTMCLVAGDIYIVISTTKKDN